MLILLREVRMRADGTADSLDREASVEQFKIGGASDQDLQLSGEGIAPAHAFISGAAGRLQLRCRGASTVIVNGARKTSVALAMGDLIEIGAHRLTIFEPPPGFDLALELQTAGAPRDEALYESTFTTRLEQTWLSKRRVAWTLAATIIIAFMLVPLALLAMHRTGAHAVFFLPSDRLWSSGPLSAAHQQAIGDNCGMCHQKLFRRVRDDACEQCHRTVHDHVEPSRLLRTTFGAKPRCESCHREHLEPVPNLIVRDDALCVDCHGRDARAFGSTEFGKVTNFSTNSHPEFRLHVLRMADVNAMDSPWRYETVALAGAREKSNLKFSHVQHLDAERVAKNGSDNALGCGDCHVPDADGYGFRPITMKGACVSCHELTFDQTEPTRQLPHGKPREVVLTLQEFYARRYLDPSTQPPPVERRRLPGEPALVSKCTDSALVCARQSATNMVETQFNARGCHDCHVINDTKSTDLIDRFQVLPVRLGDTFFPHARFKHSSHRVQGTLTGDAACASCHGANKSRSSEDVLIPGMQACVGCHSGSSKDRAAAAATLKINAARDAAVLGCSNCHDYHPRNLRGSSDDEALTRIAGSIRP